jgi:hypothetical protein
VPRSARRAAVSTNNHVIAGGTGISATAGWCSCCCRTARFLYGQYVVRIAPFSQLLDNGDRAAVLAELDDYLQTSERHVLNDLSEYERATDP